MDRKEIEDFLWKCCCPLQVHITQCQYNNTTIQQEYLEHFKNEIIRAPEDTRHFFYICYENPTRCNMMALLGVLGQDTHNYKVELNKLMMKKVNYSCDNCEYFKDDGSVNIPDGEKLYTCKVTGTCRTMTGRQDRGNDCNYFTPVDFNC